MYGEAGGERNKLIRELLLERAAISARKRISGNTGRLSRSPRVITSHPRGLSVIWRPKFRRTYPLDLFLRKVKQVKIPAERGCGGLALLHAPSNV